MHRALAGAQRQCQGGTRPRLAIGEAGKHRGKFFLDRLRQRHHLRTHRRLQGITARCRDNAGQRLECFTQPADFHAKPGAMGFIRKLQTERPGDQHFPLNVGRPRLGQRTGEHEQDRPRRERHRHATTAHNVPAGIHHQ
ncbi:hypothetical protein D3C78_1196510 [compost metagenome]